MKNPIIFKIMFSLMIVLFLFSNFISAETIPAGTTPVRNNFSITTTDLQNSMIADGIKTRSEITSYLDKKFDQQNQGFRTDFQKYVDENFKQIDATIHFLFIKVQIQLIIAIFFTILIANAVWYFIKKKILKKEEKKPNYITIDEYMAKKMGLATPEFQQALDERNRPKHETPSFTQQQVTPTPPSMEEINDKFQDKKRLEAEREQQKNKINKEKEEKRKQKNKEEYEQMAKERGLI